MAVILFALGGKADVIFEAEYVAYGLSLYPKLTFDDRSA
jgi:hypothetical protein